MSKKRLIIGICAVLAVMASAVYVKYNLSEWAMYYTKQIELRKALWLWKLDALTGDFYTFPVYREQQIGELYFKLQDWDRARKYYEHMLEGKDPERDAGKYLTAFRHFAIACLKSGAEERGREIVSSFMSAGPESMMPALMMDDLVTYDMAYPEITPQVEQYVVANETGGTPVHSLKLGLFYLQVQQPEKAVALMKREQREDTSQVRTLVYDVITAIALERLDRRGDAISLCTALTDSADDNVGKLILLSHFCQKNAALIPQGLQWARHGIQILESEKELTNRQKNNLSGLHHICAELLFDDGRVLEAVEMMNRAISLAEKNDIRWYLGGRLAEFRKALNPV